jgi:hypothetical protein
MVDKKSKFTKKQLVKIKKLQPKMKEPKKTTFMDRLKSLKEKAYEHRYKIAAGVGTAVVVGAGAYKLNQYKKEKEASILEKNKELEKLKNASTLNTQNIEEFLKTTENRLVSLKNETDGLYTDYRKKVDDFASGLEKLEGLKSQLHTLNEQRKNAINDEMKKQLEMKINALELQISDTTGKLQFQLETNTNLEAQLNEKIQNSEEEGKRARQTIEEAKRIIGEKDLTIDEKNKKIERLTQAGAELQATLQREREIQKQAEAELNRIKKEHKQQIYAIKVANKFKMNVLENKLKSITKNMDDLESKLSKSIQNVSELSGNIKTKNFELEKVKSELISKAGLSNEQVNKLNERISQLQDKLNEEQTNFIKKQDEINGLQTIIAKQKIEEVIKSYESKLNDYNLKNKELEQKKQSDDLENQRIEKQIEHNNAASKSIKLDLVRLIEVQKKINEDNKRLKILNAKQGLLKHSLEIEQNKKNRMLEAKIISSEKRNEQAQQISNVTNFFIELKSQAKQNGFESEFVQAITKAENNKRLKIEKVYREGVHHNKNRFGNFIIQYLTANEIQSIYDKMLVIQKEKQQDEDDRINKEKEREKKLEKLRENFNKNIEQLRVGEKDGIKYVKTILNRIESENNMNNKIEILNYGLELYGCLSFYNSKIKDVDENALHTRIKHIVDQELKNLNELIKKLGKESEVTEFKSNDFYKENKIQNICKLITSYIILKDKLFPVRIVVNFGLKSPNTPLEIDSTIPNTNYKNSKISAQQNNFETILPSNDLQGLKKNQGPFYLVTNTSSDDYKVDEDIDRMFTNKDEKNLPHVIYSAYGFSGAGKSFTLLQQKGRVGGDLSILKRVLNYVKTKSKKDIKLKYTVYDYYGEIEDGLCNVSKKESASKINDIQYVISPINYSEIKVDESEKIIKTIDVFDDERIKNKSGFGGRSAYHIRYTPNNDKSSRSHLFIDIDIIEDGKTKGRVTILDMAGSENVDTIQSSYFDSVDTEYNTYGFNQAITNIISDLKSDNNEDPGLVEIFKTLSQSAKDTKSLKTALKTAYNQKKKFKQLVEYTNNITEVEGQAYIPDITPVIGAPGNFIKKQEWLALAHNLKNNDMNNFANNYNNYNYFILLEPLFLLKHKLDEMFAYKTNDKKNGSYIGEVGGNLFIKNLNDLFENIGLKRLDSDFINTTKFLQSIVSPGLKNFVQTTIGVEFNGYLKKIIDNIVEKIENNTEYYTLLQKYKEDFKKNNGYPSFMYLGNVVQNKYYTEPKLSKEIFDKPNIKKYKVDIENWNAIYLYKIHCSVRFQGNFINETLGEMKNYITNIQNQIPDNTNFPGNILSKTFSTTNTKFVLFTNIRLDFNPTTEPGEYSTYTGVKPESHIQNDNIKQAYINSLKFANDINPLTKGSSFGKRKVKKYSQKLKHKVVKQHKSLLKHIKLLKKMKF